MQHYRLSTAILVSTSYSFGQLIENGEDVVHMGTVNNVQHGLRHDRMLFLSFLDSVFQLRGKAISLLSSVFL